MPDWQELVRRRLSGLALDASEKEEVHAELAAHLEESYGMLCRNGLPEKEAAERTMEQVSDWRDLQAKILIARRGEFMRKRAQQLWIPGFLTFILSTFFLMTLPKILGAHPRTVESVAGTILFDVPWLAALPFIGALGAYLSSRAGAARAIVLLASVFPVPALAAALILMFPIAMIVDPIIGNHVDFRNVATEILKVGTSWFFVPGAALLTGGLVVSLFFGLRSSQQTRWLDSEAKDA